MAETIRVLVSEEDVDKRIMELGKKISEDYAGKQVHLICVLKGGVFFMCELAKRITVPVSMDFMCVSSYGDGTTSVDFIFSTSICRIFAFGAKVFVSPVTRSLKRAPRVIRRSHSHIA